MYQKKIVIAAAIIISTTFIFTGCKSETDKKMDEIRAAVESNTKGFRGMRSIMREMEESKKSDSFGKTVHSTLVPSTSTPSNTSSDITSTISTPSTASMHETTSQRNALRAAKAYLDTMPFSHSGLVEQLEFEQYSHEDAVYAADHCGADWNQQAVRTAKTYLDTIPSSRNELIEQLEFEGFTHEQAVYGVNSTGL